MSYLHATFVTPIMRYKDDVELRLDDDRIHIRSASRVGYSDLGANRQRVARLTVEFAAALKSGCGRVEERLRQRVKI